MALSATCCLFLARKRVRNKETNAVQRPPYPTSTRCTTVFAIYIQQRATTLPHKRQAFNAEPERMAHCHFYRTFPRVVSRAARAMLEATVFICGPLSVVKLLLSSPSTPFPSLPITVCSDLTRVSMACSVFTATLAVLHRPSRSASRILTLPPLDLRIR